MFCSLHGPTDTSKIIFWPAFHMRPSGDDCTKCSDCSYHAGALYYIVKVRRNFCIECMERRFTRCEGLNRMNNGTYARCANFLTLKD